MVNRLIKVFFSIFSDAEMTLKTPNEDKFATSAKT